MTGIQSKDCMIAVQRAVCYRCACRTNNSPAEDCQRKAVDRSWLVILHDQYSIGQAISTM